jgi:hypothetical protein
MARLVVELDGFLKMVMSAGKVAEIKAGGAGNAVSDHGLRAIRPGRGFAQEKFGHFAHRCGFATVQMPRPKTVIGRKPFRRVFHLVRQFAGAREGRARFRRRKSLGPDQRLPVAGLEAKAALAHHGGIAHLIALRERGEEGLRFGEFGELLGRREALDRRRQHGVGVGVTIGRAVKLGKRQRGAQFEAARLLRPRDGDRGLQRPLGRRGIGRVALQQDLAADAAHFRFVPALLGALYFGQRIVQAPEPGISLAGTRFGFGQPRFETGHEIMPTLLPMDGDAASHPGEGRLFGIVGPLCPALKKYCEAGQIGGEIVSR